MYSVMIITYNMNIITLYHGIIDRMSHIQKQNLSLAMVVETGGVCDAAAYICILKIGVCEFSLWVLRKSRPSCGIA